MKDNDNNKPLNTEDAGPDCACHCHHESNLPAVLQCRCIKNCQHCHPKNFSKPAQEPRSSCCGAEIWGEGNAKGCSKCYLKCDDPKPVDSVGGQERYDRNSSGVSDMARGVPTPPTGKKEEAAEKVSSRFGRAIERLGEEPAGKEEWLPAWTEAILKFVEKRPRAKYVEAYDFSDIQEFVRNHKAKWEAAAREEGYTDGLNLRKDYTDIKPEIIEQAYLKGFEECRKLAEHLVAGWHFNKGGYLVMAEAIASLTPQGKETNQPMQ